MKSKSPLNAPGVLSVKHGSHNVELNDKIWKTPGVQSTCDLQLFVPCFVTKTNKFYISDNEYYVKLQLKFGAFVFSFLLKKQLSFV